MLQTSGKGLGNWLTGLLKIVLIPWIEHRWDLFCPDTVQWLLARARNTNDDQYRMLRMWDVCFFNQAQQYGKNFCGHVLLSSCDPVHFACRMPILSSLNILRSFYILLFNCWSWSSWQSKAWRCPVGSLSAPIFLTHCLRGLKLITLHSVGTLDALLLGFDTIALISLWLLGNLPSWTWVHEQNFGFSFS